MTERPPAGRDRPRSTDKRQILIDAASRVITAEGVAAATTRRVADEAGLPPGLVHYWFADKDELMEAVLVTLHDDTVRQSLDAHDPGATLTNSFRSSLDVAVTKAPMRQLALYELILSALRTPSQSRVAEDQHARRLSATTAYLEPFDAHLDATFPGGRRALAALLAALLDGIALTWLATEDRDRLESAVSTLDLLLRRAGL